jgi:hypothetical protein
MWRMSDVELRRATDADAEAVADVFIDSFRAALPTVRRAHDDADVRRYVRDVLVAQTECWVAVDGSGRVVAMMSLKPGWVEQLYVAPDRLGDGIGRRVIGLAKERSAMATCSCGPSRSTSGRVASTSATASSWPR